MKWTHGLAVAATAGLALQSAWAQSQARVLSTVPVVQNIAVPQQVCNTEEVYAGQRTTGAGAVIGAIIGGVAGSALGAGGHRGHHGHHHGPSRTATAAIGAIAGGVIGNQIEGTNGGTPAYQQVQRCENETVYEQRTVGYDVTYEYAGQRYTTRMDHDPGQWMPVQVQPGHTSYGSNKPSHTTHFVGPSGYYESAPAGVPVMQPPPPPPPHWRQYDRY